jgi:hypothetical protein
MRGRLEKAKDTRRQLEAQASLHIRAAREVLDPFRKPVTTIKVEEAEQAVKGLTGIITSLRELEATIKDLEEALG